MRLKSNMEGHEDGEKSSCPFALFKLHLVMSFFSSNPPWGKMPFDVIEFKVFNLKA